MNTLTLHAMAMASTLRAQLKNCFTVPSIRSFVAEFISTFLFVFTTVGSVISARMAAPDAELVATALAEGLGLFAAVLIAADVSGGHVNPAVTFAFAVSGRIDLPSAVFYGVSQLAGSTFACVVLHHLSAGQAVPTTRIAKPMTGFAAAVLEGMMTFMVVYTVHVVGVPRARGADGNGTTRKGIVVATAVAALAIGLETVACALALGPLTGGSMNPARSFGAAYVSGQFGNQAVYWTGPIIGAAVAALVQRGILGPSVPGEAAPNGNVEMVGV